MGGTLWQDDGTRRQTQTGWTARATHGTSGGQRNHVKSYLRREGVYHNICTGALSLPWPPNTPPFSHWTCARCMAGAYIHKQ